MRKKLLLTAIFAFTLAFSTACVDSGVSGNSDTSKESQASETVSSSQGAEEDSSTVGGDETEKDVYCVVTFDTDGGSAVAAVTVKKGEKVTEPTAPKKSNQKGEYEFLGWYYNDKAWDFATDSVTEDITLVAKWKQESGYTNPFLPKN